MLSSSSQTLCPPRNAPSTSSQLLATSLLAQAFLSLCLVMWVQAEQDRDPRMGQDRIQPQQAGDTVPTHIMHPLQVSPPGQGRGDPLATSPPLSLLGSHSREQPLPPHSRMSPGLSIPQPCTQQGEHGH